MVANVLIQVFTVQLCELNNIFMDKMHLKSIRTRLLDIFYKRNVFQMLH